jgi:hypothetical protein
MKVKYLAVIFFSYIFSCDIQVSDEHDFISENRGTPFWYYNSYSSNWPYWYDYPFNWRYSYW